MEHMFYYNTNPFPFWSQTMSKLIGEPVKVHQNKDSMITAFIWRRRLYKVVEVLGWWREPSEWPNGKAIRLFARVNAMNLSTSTYELYKPGEEWFLHKVLV